MPYGIGGVLPDWNIDNSANRFNQSYVKDFIDISGSLLLRNNANLYVNGNTTVNGNLFLNNTNLQTDLSFNKRIFVGSDMSMNGNANIANDVSLNGIVLDCSFNGNSIPTSAFAGTVTAAVPDYTKASTIYQQKFQANADVSLNGNTVQATNIKVNGNIVFNDGTKMSTYDNNIEVNYGSPFSIKKTYDISGVYDPSYNNGGSAGSIKPIRCSIDGKYVAISYNDYINSTANTANTTGIDISQDYGMTFTRKYLTIPGTATPIYRPHPIIAMSNDGKYMLTVAYGTYTESQPHKTSTNVVGLSSDYGTTWSTVYLNTILGIGESIVAFVAELAISTSPNRILIVAAINIAQAAQTMVNTSLSLTGFTQFATPLSINEFGGQLRIIGNRIVHFNYNASEFGVWDLLSGNQVGVSGFTENGFVAYSVFFFPSTSTLFVKAQEANTGIQKVYRVDNLQSATPSAVEISPTMSPTNLARSCAVSTNGQYVLLGFATGAFSASPALSALQGQFTFTQASDNRLLLSTDYGSSFTSIGPLNPTSDINRQYYTSIAITDSGRIYIFNLNDKTVGITVATASIFKAATFTGLTIKNTLTAGSYVVSSDYRIKTDVAKLDNLFTVDNLRPVKYLQTLTNKQQYGVIAHELQQYYPDLVIGEKDGTDLQRVNYTGLIAILINEITQMKRELAELEKKL
jgi:hypothetical protein